VSYLLASLVSLPIAGLAAYRSRAAGLAIVILTALVTLPVVLLTGLAWQAVAYFWGPAALGYLMGSGIRKREEIQGLRA
jgi:hypothetical protein